MMEIDLDNTIVFYSDLSKPHCPVGANGDGKHGIISESILLGEIGPCAAVEV